MRGVGRVGDVPTAISHEIGEKGMRPRGSPHPARGARASSRPTAFAGDRVPERHAVARHLDLQVRKSQGLDHRMEALLELPSQMHDQLVPVAACGHVEHLRGGNTKRRVQDPSDLLLSPLSIRDGLRRRTTGHIHRGGALAPRVGGA